MANAKKIKVALIEDDQMLSDMYTMKFQKEGFDIQTAQDGADGVELVKKMNPDIILLDIIMPRMDGFEALKIMRESGVKVPIVMLTNLGQEEDIQKGREYGATDYFVKSNYTPDAITQKVQSILEKK